jgi:hypothetical protein
LFNEGLDGIERASSTAPPWLKKWHCHLFPRHERAAVETHGAARDHAGGAQSQGASLPHALQGLFGHSVLWGVIILIAISPRRISTGMCGSPYPLLCGYTKW